MLKKLFTLTALLMCLFFQAHAAGQITAGGVGRAAHSGDVNICVLLIEFTDAKFNYSDSRYLKYGNTNQEKVIGYFEDFLNGEKFSDSNHFSSQREFFIEQSRGKYRPHFDIYGPINMGMTVAEGKATAINQLGNKAATIANETLDIDFSKYDAKGEGTVNGIVLVVPKGTIGCVTQKEYLSPTLDGKRLGTTMIGPEFDNGAFTHEFGHLLGLPDYYNGAGAYTTPEYWDIMDNGCYNGGPISFSSLERWLLGWTNGPSATFRPGDKAASVILPSLTDRDFFIKIETGREGEFYLLENRTKTGYDKNLRAEGMLIWHVDAAKNDWLTSPNTDVNHMRIDLVRADNEKKRGGGLTSYAGDPFPGSTGNTAFGANTTPQMFRWVNETSDEKIAVEGCEITNIRRNATTGEISFDFNGGSATNIIKPASITTPRYTISAEASPSEGGTATVDGSSSVTVDAGTRVKFEATPASNFNFLNWTRDDNVVSTNPSFSTKILSPDQASTYRANFRSKNAVNIKVEANKTNAGTVTVNGKLEYDANPGESVTLKATPIDGVKFLGWKKGTSSTYISTESTYTLSNVKATDAGIYTATFEVTGCILTIVCEPDNGGNVVIEGHNSNPLHVAKNTKLVLHATPADNFKFAGYFVNGTNYGSNPTINYTISVDRTVVAKFVPLIPTFTMGVNTTEGGSANVNGSSNSIEVEQGKTANYVATPNEGYVFINWTNASGEEQSTNAVWTMWPEYAATYTANFKKAEVEKKYTLSAKCSPATAGSATVNDATGSAEVSEGSSATFSATANQGYEFVSWTNATGSVVSTEAVYVIEKVTQNTTLTANFREVVIVPTFTISAYCSPSAAGTITVNGKTGSADIEKGKSATISVTANAGFEFTHWTKGTSSESVSTEPTFTIDAVEANASYTAHFNEVEIEEWNVQVVCEPAAGGTATINGRTRANLENNSYAHFIAVPNPGYTFGGWVDAVGNTFSSADLEIQYLPSWRFGTWKAKFEGGSEEPETTYTINVKCTPATGGTATVNGAASSEVAEGGEAILKAVPNSGFIFSKWTKGTADVSTDAEYTIKNVTEAASYTAVFKQAYTYSVVCNPAEGGTATVNGAQSAQVAMGETVAFVAEPADGYKFINWTKGTATPSKDTEFSLSAGGTSAGTYTANFEKVITSEKCRIAAVCSPAEAGSVSVNGGGTMADVAVGSEVTLSATANSGYEFVSWIKGVETVSTSATCTITAGGYDTYVATFKEAPELDPNWTVWVVCEPEDAGIATVGGKKGLDVKIDFFNKPKLTFEAIPNRGYKFESWNHSNMTPKSVNPTTETISTAYAGQWTAKFTQLFPTKPTGEMHENVFLTTIATEGGFDHNDINYTSAVHPGKFHNVVKGSGIQVLPGKSFTLKLEGSGLLTRSADASLNNCSAFIYSDWTDSGNFTLEAQYGKDSTAEEDEVLNISHELTAPESAAGKKGYLRVLYVDKSNAQDGSLDHIAADANAQDIKTAGISYELPVEVLPESMVGLSDIELDGIVNAIYDIQGRRLRRITEPGIYIVNGRKVVVTRPGW